MSKIIEISNTEKETIENLIKFVIEKISELSKTQDWVTVGLSGGSLIKLLTNEFIKNKSVLEPFINKIKFLFCDERFVALDHSDSTYYGYSSSGLFAGLNIPEESIFHIKADAETVEQCAVDYQNRVGPLLNKNNGLDILLLGLGPDGHTCSLFPGHKLYVDAANETRLVAPISDSPKPPPQRVTLTLNYINRSSFLLFCAYGEGKAEILKRILSDGDLSLPSAGVKPVNNHGVLKWFIDTNAAKLL